MVENIQVLIALPTPVPDELIAQVRQVSPRLQVEVRRAAALAEVADNLAKAEVLLTSFGLPEAAQAPRLRWVQAYSAGVEGWLAAGGDRLKDMALTTASGVHGPVMAEHSLMLMLAWAHQLPPMMSLQQRHEWPAERWKLLRTTELRGATLGIVGYGSIGRETARLACAMGMRVLACKHDPRRREDTGWVVPGTGDPAGALPDQYYAIENLHDMLAECDYVLLTLALTPATRHIIDAAALRHMKPSVVLVNVARGGLVDEPALIDALRNGVIHAAGLDVFEKEPLPEDSPLWSLPNALLTPHISGYTPAYEERLLVLFTENLQRYLTGQRLLNQVDLAAGY